MILKSITDNDDIAGRVIDSEGNPIIAAQVDAWTWYQGNETKTNSLGFFWLKNIPSDGKTAQLRISAADHCPELITHQPRGVCDLQITLSNKTYLYGRIYNTDGSPASDAVVKAKQGPVKAEGVVISSVWTETKADPNGFYKLFVDNDDYILIAQKANNSRESLRKISIKKGQGLKADFHFKQTCKFRAYMIDAQSNNPVADVALADWHKPFKQAFSDKRGYLEVAGLDPGRHYFVINSYGYARWRSEQSITVNKTKNLNQGIQRDFDLICFDIEPNSPDIAKIYLERAAAVSGKIADPDGKPVKNVTVTAALTGTGNSISGDSRFKTFTKRDGTFKLFLPSSKDRQYNLVAHVGNMHTWKDWANGISKPFFSGPGEVIKNMDINLNYPCKIQGTVVTPDGKACKGIAVRATAADFCGNRYFNPSAVTDENGRFTLEYLRPGKHYIQAQPFWLDPRQAPARSCKLVKVSPESRLNDIQLVSIKNDERLSLK
jgi:hypothetical protein